MNFDKRIKVIKEELVPDGMGGFEVSHSQSIGTILAFTVPVPAEIMLKENGIVSTNSMKVYTKDSLEDREVQLEYNEKRYEIIQYADYEKFRIILVQEITKEGDS